MDSDVDFETLLEWQLASNKIERLEEQVRLAAIAIKDRDDLERERDEWETRADNCAKEIEHLRAEIERLRALLREWVGGLKAEHPESLLGRSNAALGEG